MTRTYAAKRLLEHGELSFPQFVTITGWDRRVAWRCMNRLVELGIVDFVGLQGCRVYRLAD